MEFPEADFQGACPPETTLPKVNRRFNRKTGPASVYERSLTDFHLPLRYIIIPAAGFPVNVKTRKP
ncbi:MAG TPA: hypothetical protein DEB39_06615 [Planctomycetaceae bacterium]|nr:hypothetical protein [Planctomycetaceae bacterium]